MKRTIGYSTQGQVTVEAVIGVVFVVAAVIFMAAHMQRSMQGGLFEASQSFGLPFDSRDGYTETQHLSNLNEHMQQQVAWGMVGAELRPADPLGPYNSGPKHSDWVLSSLPTGSVFREPGFQGSVVDSNWQTSRTATYDDNR